MSETAQRKNVSENEHMRREKISPPKAELKKSHSMAWSRPKEDNFEFMETPRNLGE